MKNIPMNMASFELFVTTKPEVAEYADKETGEVKQRYTFGDDPRPIYRLSLFAKSQALNPWGGLDLGEEILVDIPGVDTTKIRKGTFVELVNPTASPEAKQSKGGKVYLAMNWKADGVEPTED